MNKRHAFKILNISLIVVLIGLVSYIAFWPVDVLANWQLKVSATSYRAGEVITVESIYEKKMAVSGTAHRYIECKDRRDIWVRYQLSEAQADRSPGALTGTGIQITLPTNIPNLPATCRLSISVDYKINLLKTHTEYNQTGEFTLLPAETSSDETSDPVAASDTPSSSTTTQSGSSSSSSSSSAPTASQQPSQPAPAQPEPSVIDQLLALPGKLIGGK